MAEQKQYFPLSNSQQNIWNLECAYPGTSINVISTTVRIRGHLDLPLLQKSIQRVLECDRSLHTRLAMVDGQVVQYYAAYQPEDFPVYDFCNTSASGFENWEVAVTRERIPLENAPLFRFFLFRDAEGSGGVLVKLHHIISDGWSQVSVCNKISQTYLDLLADRQPELAEVPDYQLHVQEEAEYACSKACAKDEKYWRGLLENASEPSALKHITSSSVSPVGRRLSFELPQILNHAIYSFCQANRVAPFAVFYMALAIYFKRITGSDQFTIGVPIFNRTNYLFKQSTGMFVTTLPFINAIDDQMSLNQFNEDLMEKWYALLRHQRYPFSKIAALREQDGRLFHIALSYQDSIILQSRNTSVEFSGRWHYCGYQAEQLTIHLTNLKDHQRYAVDYDYLAQYFSEEEIKFLHQNLCHILNETLREPDRPIYKLNLLSMDSKNTLLYTFNDTDKYLPDISVYDALVSRSTKYLNRVALICNGERLSYGALLQLSSRYAAAIHQLELSENSLVAILLPRNFDLFSAMVGSLQAGCGYMLLSRELPTERLTHILKQSGASVLITDAQGAARISGWSGRTIRTEQMDTDDNFLIYTGINRGQDTPCQERLAYVVYTSGSTGEPKGVEISHQNVMNLAQEMAPIYGQGAVLSVCNVGFDAFVLESISALLNGRTIVLPADEELESPDRLAALINGYAVGFLATTPSRLSAFLSTKAFCKIMWRMESLVCGGEAFPPELLKRLKKLTGARIYNQYGPSETTVGVSIKELSHAERITAGKPMGNCRMYVLDQWLNPLPIGGYGQLYVGGKCVGLGYRNQPVLTQKSFFPSPFVINEQIYSTGDVACWTPEGEIQLRGRADDQVKLRGLRIELQEISSCVEAFPGVHSAVAKICSVHNEQVLGVYYCAEDTVSDRDILVHITTYLPRYMIPAFMMRLPQIPRNANGKADASRLPLPAEPQMLSRQELSVTAARILDIFCQVLDRQDLHGNSDYFMSGGNSLNAMDCIVRIEDVLGQRIRIADLYACRSAVKLAAFMDGAPLCAPETSGSRSGFQKAPYRDSYELSPIQQGIYVQSALDPSGLTYHMPGAFLLENAPDQVRLENAFRALIQADPIFRTSFCYDENGIHAHVHKQVDFALEALQAADFNEACQKFLRPFRLDMAPLLRAALWQSPEGKWHLFVDVHHMIGDGMSTPILLKRLDEAYRTGNAAVQWDFYDCLCAPQPDVSHDLQYWQEHLRALPEPLVLPCDHSRPKQFNFMGKEYACTLSNEESARCAAFCKENGVSEFALFLSAFGILLSSISGREDLLIGAPAAGRLIPQAQQVCGPFINTLPLRLQPGSELTARQWIARVQEEITGMLDHQQVSLESILQALELPRSAQNALYQVMMSQSPVDTDGFSLDGHKMVCRPIETNTAKMDLCLELAREQEQYVLRFSYASSLFLEETIAFYGRCMQTIVANLIAHPQLPLHQISKMSPLDHQRFVELPNYRISPFVNLPLHKLLHNRIASSPDSTAVIFHDEAVSCGALERRANAIAQFLVDQGLQIGQSVGLCLSRSVDMIAAMYGVLKAGGSFTFMLPTFPTARIHTMLRTACSALLLCDEAAKAQLAADFWRTEAPCPIYGLPEGELDFFADRPVSSENLAQIHFTSGSTGQPKGVMLRHRSVSNLCLQVKNLLEPYPGNVLCSTNSVFDCFLMETLVALTLGRVVVLADEEEMMLPWKLARLVSQYETAVFEMTPTRLQMCLQNDAFCAVADHIRVLLVGGEALTKNLQQLFHTHSTGQLINMYGPSESTIYTTFSPLQPQDPITIGRPLENIRSYVLDEKMRPVLPTGCGELYIAGECLAAGYISRPDLTEAAFLEDIYFPGEKMYRSGDMVRLRVDGSYEFLGRKDAQVKLNGQRVELTEISGAIMEYGQAAQAAVVALRKDDGAMELCAFYVPQPQTPDTAQILTAIGQILPPYMIPSRLLRISAMPMTASNKIDMLALKKMAAEPAAPAETTPAMPKFQPAPAPVPADPQAVRSEGVDYIFSVWNRVLRNPVTDAKASFFALGGTSMDALSVLSCYYNDHFEMSLADFYAHPSAAEQAQILCTDRQKATPVADITPETPALPTTIEISNTQPGEYTLVTGATGFFGAHLVRELLMAAPARPVLCLTRDGDIQRLLDCLGWYFGQGFVQRFRDRLEVVQGDIAKPQLNMDAPSYQQLCNRVGRIFHSAADVRHYAADAQQYLQTNVDGTANMLCLAQRAGAAFYHISTCSVSGMRLLDSDRAVDFTENDYDIGQDWQSNIYVRSKFLAEGLVLQAAKAGLNAKIFRMGRLVGRMSDGLFQRNPHTNAFYLLLQSFLQIGAVPQSAADIRVDLMPIDLSAREVLALTQGPDPVYHILNADPPTLRQIVEAIGQPLQIVSDEAFDEIFAQKRQQMNPELLGVASDYLHRCKHEPGRITPTNVLTEKTLAKLQIDTSVGPIKQILQDFLR